MESFFISPLRFITSKRLLCIRFTYYACCKPLKRRKLILDSSLREHTQTARSVLSTYKLFCVRERNTKNIITPIYYLLFCDKQTQLSVCSVVVRWLEEKVASTRASSPLPNVELKIKTISTAGRNKIKYKIHTRCYEGLYIFSSDIFALNNLPYFFVYTLNVYILFWKLF